MWIHWVSTYFVDPENWIGQMYDSQFAGTWKASAWYQNDEVDTLLREARETSDQAKRAELYEKAARIVVDDAADIWVYNTVQLRGMTDRVEGYTSARSAAAPTSARCRSPADRTLAGSRVRRMRDPVGHPDRRQPRRPTKTL